jgi:glucuronate isomerase
MADLWLSGDHYKWRLMRADGVDERLITGDAPGKEKFRAYAKTLEKAIGNPLYDWSHLELQRYFGFHRPLTAENADEVYGLCNEKLRSMSARSLILASNVRLICTTDDPADDLGWHKKIRDDRSFPVKVIPGFRPEKATDIRDEGYLDYLETLSKASGINIDSLPSLKKALADRISYFAENGCVLSDHSFPTVPTVIVSDEVADRIFDRRLKGEPISEEEAGLFDGNLMVFLAKAYAERGWAMQLHYGVRRNANSLLYHGFGRDVGGDCINAHSADGDLAAFLDACLLNGGLPKTIVYSLNPNDDAYIDSVLGCFQGLGQGYLQHGAAWWFNDSRVGIRHHLDSLSSGGLLGDFIGMLTDSRSFVSYPRHEYFRRVLCSYIGEKVEEGSYPNDAPALEKLVRGISYENAVRYFGFDVPLD